MSRSRKETVIKLVVVVLALWGFLPMPLSEDRLTLGQACRPGRNGAGRAHSSSLDN